MEKDPQPKDPVLHFVVDGIRYALEQNAIPRKEALDSLVRWFPDVHIVALIEDPLPLDKGANA